MTDEFYMKRALRLARRGERWVSPNPMVGAVIVRDGRIIGEGYHRRFGGAHGELNAMNGAREPLAGATVYVTLEPCSHYGKTPPCADRLIEARVARVVIGTLDPNPLVAGRGLEALRRAGVETTVGVMEEACRRINERFFHFMTTGLPFVTLKYAQTMDGRIASASGDSRWISSLASRKFAHGLRALHDAILAGAGTILHDDPELTVRHVRGRNPVRIIVDSRLRIPFEAKVLQGQESARTIIASTPLADPGKRKLLQEKGIEVLTMDADENECVNLGKLFLELGKRGISSVLAEGGSAVITSLLKENLADRLIIITAPKILGRGIDAVADLGSRRMDEAMNIVIRKVYRLDGDIIIDALPGRR